MPLAPVTAATAVASTLPPGPAAALETVAPTVAGVPLPLPLTAVPAVAVATAAVVPGAITALQAAKEQEVGEQLAVHRALPVTKQLAAAMAVADAVVAAPMPPRATAALEAIVPAVARVPLALPATAATAATAFAAAAVVPRAITALQAAKENKVLKEPPVQGALLGA